MFRSLTPLLCLLATSSSLFACGSSITAKLNIGNTSIPIKSIVGLLDTGAYEESFNIIVSNQSNLCSNIINNKPLANLDYARLVLTNVDNAPSYVALTTGTYSTSITSDANGNATPGLGIRNAEFQTLNGSCANTANVQVTGTVSLTDLKTLEGSFDLNGSDGVSSLSGKFTATTCSGATAAQFQQFNSTPASSCN